MSWLTSRQTKYGAYSGTYILVFLAILVAANYLANRYNKSFDATKDKLYSLSDQTERILGDLDRDITIYYFDRKTNFVPAESSLVRYENVSHRVTVNYIDPDSQLDMAEAMNVRTFGTVIVEAGARREEANSTEEQEVTNAIIRVLKGEDRTACILTGHGEADSADDNPRDGFSAAKTEIESANYQTQVISLLENPEIPSTCTLLIIAGPETDYFEPEIDLLRRYVEGGGRALFMIDYEQSPSLVALLASWGIEVRDDIVIDTSGIGQLFGGGPLAPLVAQYEPHPISEVMGNVATLFPMTRSVVSGTAQNGWTVSTLFSTTANSFATTELEVEDGELRRDASLETPGPIPVGVAATYDVPASDSMETGGEDATEEEISADTDPAEEMQGRIVVTGTSHFARNNFIGRGGNIDLLLNMLNWLSSDEDLISIRPKDPENTPINLSQTGMSGLFWGTVVCLPLFILLSGVRVWWIRR